MDPRALLESVIAVGITPLASFVLAAAVVAGIYVLIRKTNRG
jgi:hypothetical protein